MQANSGTSGNSGVALSKVKIGSVFLVDPTRKPRHEKPAEEEFTDAKIMFFHPKLIDQHERRKQAGISEGLVSFFNSFTEESEPIECIATSEFTHVVKEVEPDMWLNMVIKHPSNLYGVDQRTKDNLDSGETIANQKFQHSFFREEDSKIFHRLIDVFYSFFTLYHGNFKQLYDKCQISSEAGKGHEKFEMIMEEFTNNFVEYYFDQDYVKNTFWNLCFQGFQYCPIDKKTFLHAQYIQNGLMMEFEDLQHVAIFHDDYFISSTLTHQQVQPLYSYIVGNIDQPPKDERFPKVKILQFKGTGSYQHIEDDEDDEPATMEVRQDMDTMSMSNRSYAPRESVIDHYNQTYMDLAISDFCKVNPPRSTNVASVDQQALQYLFARFLIGPQLYKGKKFVDVFAPTVHIKDTNPKKQATKYKLMVYQGYKTLMVMLFNEDTCFSSTMLRGLTNHLNKQLPGTSQMIEQVIQRGVSSNDQLRFFYYSKMNLAIKFSNRLTKDIFSYELKTLVNQMHEQFVAETELLEQVQNTAVYWLVGIQSLGREIYLIFPPNYTSNKVDAEKKKILEAYFENLFI